MAEPNRTPGKAEGTVESGQPSGNNTQTDVGQAGRASTPNGEPNRTPGKAEGTKKDVEGSLNAQEKKQ